MIGSNASAEHPTMTAPQAVARSLGIWPRVALHSLMKNWRDMRQVDEDFELQVQVSSSCINPFELTFV